jgi:hypothetical protein
MIKSLRTTTTSAIQSSPAHPQIFVITESRTPGNYSMEDKDRIARVYMRQKERVTRELVRRLGVHNLTAIEAVVHQADILRDFEGVVEELYLRLVNQGVTAPAERTVPMSLKANVHDEWAAVARHQDDVQRMADYERVIVQKEQQQRYRQELDALVQYKRSCETDEIQRHDTRLVKDLVERDLKLTSEYRRGEQTRRAVAQQYENEGRLHAAYKQSQVRQHRTEEQQRYMDALDKEQRAQKEQELRAQEVRRRQQEAINSFNDRQQYYKQRDTQLQHIEDYQGSKGEFGHRNAEELRRQDIMKEYAESVQQAPLAYRSKVDDYRQKVRSSTQEKWLMDSRSDAKLAAQSEINSILARQSLEREAAKASVQSEKQQLAAEMAEQLRRIRAEDESERNYKRAMQRNYSSLLDLQAQDQKRVKQEGWMMTDNERRLNQDDLYNYTSRTPRLDSKVPGLNSGSIGSQSVAGLVTPRSTSSLDTVFTRQANSILGGR